VGAGGDYQDVGRIRWRCGDDRHCGVNILRSSRWHARLSADVRPFSAVCPFRSGVPPRSSPRSTIAAARLQIPFAVRQPRRPTDTREDASRARSSARRQRSTGNAIAGLLSDAGASSGPPPDRAVAGVWVRAEDAFPIRNDHRLSCVYVTHVSRPSPTISSCQPFDVSLLGPTEMPRMLSGRISRSMIRK